VTGRDVGLAGLSDEIIERGRSVEVWDSVLRTRAEQVSLQEAVLPPATSVLQLIQLPARAHADGAPSEDGAPAPPAARARRRSRRA
jgi:hypothetical protein